MHTLTHANTYSSQFAAGYGMVLNLLYSRSLDKAKAFIDRSFNSYPSKIQLAYIYTVQNHT